MDHVLPGLSRRGRVIGAVLPIAALSAAALWGMAVGAPVNADPTPHKVTLCHATDSSTNPYVSVTVDYHAVVPGGHGKHEGPVFDPATTGDKWGDIIPAFDFGAGNQYAGMNLDAAGQAILANGCAVAPPTTTTTTDGPPGG